jgi:hypothetical protein
MALRDAEAWDDSPVIGAQVFLPAPGQDGLSEALLKLAENAKDSDRVRNPQWPSNLKTELPRSLEAQKAEAATLLGEKSKQRVLLHSSTRNRFQKQAELSDLRWLIGATCDMPASLIMV